MLIVSEVSKRFGDVVALDGIDLRVERGDLLGFLGPNGAGKTTTMQAVMGLISIDHGAITWDGEPITDQLRRTFGYMPAERGMYPKMTVHDQIVYFARLSGMDDAAAERATSTWMERVDIAHRATDEVQALSSGNQQRVQLAIALVHEPQLLVLDEPFSGLDPVAADNMKSILLDCVAQGTAVLFSSHQLDLVSDVSRDVVIVDSGRVVLSGAVREIRERSDLRLATVVFAQATSWTPGVGELIHPAGNAHDDGRAAAAAESSAGSTGSSPNADGRTARLRVGADVSPAAVLTDAERAGTVIEFSFSPPDLSEVFFTAVGR